MKSILNYKITPMTLPALLLFFASCGSTAVEQEPEGAIQVRVMEIELTGIDNELELTGIVQPFEEAHIGASMPMRIESILVDVGDRVSKGQLLVQMDRSQLFQARVQRETLRADLQRLDTLLQMGAVTQQNYDQMKAQYDIAVSNIENLERTTEIRATIPGVITGRYNSDGEIFSMTPGPAGKPAIVTVMQIRPVKIIIGVSESDYLNVEPGQEVGVVSDVFAGRTFDGKVYKIHPTIDRMSGTFKVEVLVSNEDMSLKPGMFTRVSLNLGRHEGLLVPALAVLKQAGSNERFVFVVEEGKAIRKTVQPGRNFDEKVEILDGLRAGETLVTTGQHNLLHQAEVEVINQSIQNP